MRSEEIVRSSSTPFTLASKTRSKCSSVASATGANWPMPAFTNRTSKRPKLRRTSLITRSRSSATVTSARSVTRSLGNASSPSSAAADWSVPASRPVIATRAPARRNSSAVARPMPLLPPVIRAILPASRRNVARAGTVAGVVVAVLISGPPDVGRTVFLTVTIIATVANVAGWRGGSRSVIGWSRCGRARPPG